jgi:protein TonB
MMVSGYHGWIGMLASAVAHSLALAAAIAWSLWPANSYFETGVARGEPIVISASIASQASQAVAAPQEAEPVELVPEPLERTETPLEAQKSELVKMQVERPVERPQEPEPLVELEVAEVVAAVSRAAEDPKPQETPTSPPRQRVATAAPQAASLAAEAYRQPQQVGAAVDELPRALPNNPAPIYPREAVAARQEGRVLVRALVSLEGRVTKVAVETSSGAASLDSAALAAVATWRFHPARRASVFIDYEVLVPVRFRLERS